MRVPGAVFASRTLLPDARSDKSLKQVGNVATLPGTVGASYAMPDVHWGYGFPIGGVAATVVDAGGVVSPGGVGFDISCGVRLLAVAGLDRDGLARGFGTSWTGSTTPSRAGWARVRCDGSPGTRAGGDPARRLPVRGRARTRGRSTRRRRARQISELDGPR
jgi:hypothetical protein